MSAPAIEKPGDDFDDEAPIWGEDRFRKLLIRWEQQPWSALGINLEIDRATWHRLPAGLRGELGVAVTELGGGDVAVTRLLLPLIEHAPQEAWRVYLTTQLSDEAKHAVFFRRYHDEVMGAEAAQGAISADLQEFDESSYQTVFTPLLAAAVADAGRDAEAWHRASVLYHLITEGVLGITVLRVARTLGRNRRLLPGLSEGIVGVFRDESRHITFGRGAAIAGVASGHGPAIVDAYLVGIAAAARVLVGPRRREVPLGVTAAEQRGRRRSERLDEARERCARQARALELPVEREHIVEQWDAARLDAVREYEQHWREPHSASGAIGGSPVNA